LGRRRRPAEAEGRDGGERHVEESGRESRAR